ncbi:serine carboxypeptidase [Clavulina sp. PMI_390]|nr:serine carboxypeptidase [Clavulina sp. PMI_390]
MALRAILSLAWVTMLAVVAHANPDPDPHTTQTYHSGFASTDPSQAYFSVQVDSVPSHSLRFRPTPSFCDHTVKTFSGYLDAGYGSKHFFFYFFESRNDPQTDDIVIWLNGGPGCSSATGLFMELGPCRVTPGGNGTEWHPHSWNTNANVIFLDQPIGAGFSYADFGQTLDTTDQAAVDFHAFVALFFEAFPSFQGRPLHIAGESYAGRMIPVFASHIVDMNRKSTANTTAPINLASVLIGNGLTDVVSMVPSYYDMVCTRAGFPLAPISECVKIQNQLPRCIEWTKASCVDRMDEISCKAARDFCMAIMYPALFATERNVYNLAVVDIEKYLNRPEVRELLGVSPKVPHFQGCNMPLLLTFEEKLDRYHTSPPYVAQLLERGIDVLVYVGKNDFICNHIGNYKWANALEWHGGDAFRKETLQPWVVDGEVAGEAKTVGGFTFATILDAGHMAPYDRPVQTLAMLQRWMADRRLL